MTNKRDVVEDLIDKLLTDIINKKTTLFYGAGLSIESGNLSANSIRECLLRSLKYDEDPLFEKDVIEELGNRTKKFEDFLNHIYDDVNPPDKKKLFEKLFKILYDSGYPNINHYLIAYLLNQEYVNKVYTTNFDLHLENAYKNLFSEELRISLFGKNFNKETQYVKLHGSISAIEEIGTLLTNVAKKENSDLLRSIL